MSLPFGNELPYWKTSKSSPGAWLDKTEALIEKHGGEVMLRAKGKSEGGVAFAMEFRFDHDRFKAIWPVLDVLQESDQLAAERQAATMLYHDVKARCVKIAIFGPRNAFFDFLLLPDGRTAGQMSDPELADFTPKALLR